MRNLVEKRIHGFWGKRDQKRPPPRREGGSVALRYSTN